MSRVLGCFGLSQRTTEHDLRDTFERFGNIEKVMLIIDRKTGISKGYAFIYFETVNEAAAAKRDCAGMELDGRLIRIDFSLTKKPHNPTPGLYLGRRRGGGGGHGRGGHGRGGHNRGGHSHGHSGMGTQMHDNHTNNGTNHMNYGMGGNYRGSYNSNNRGRYASRSRSNSRHLFIISP